MELLIRGVFGLFLLFAALAAAAMVATSIAILYLYSASLGKAAKLSWDEIAEISIGVFLIEATTLAIGLFVLWINTDTVGGILLTALGAILAAVIWPISIFFMLDTAKYAEMVLWATGAALLLSQAYIIFRIIRRTQSHVECGD